MALDRLGVWLSERRIRRTVGSFAGLQVVDIGCGYDATVARSQLPAVASMTLVDVAISPVLRNHPKVRAIEGRIPKALEEIQDGSQDLVICNSVLEHLWEPAETLRAVWRILAPGGVALVNVPSWRGKRFLEFSAFRLGMSPADEMQDHKAYYDPRDLWPLLVRAGFSPRDIRCGRHTFGLNTFAACRKAADERDGHTAPPSEYFPFPRHPGLLAITSELSLRGRRKMFGQFMEATEPSDRTRILDVGVTPDVSLPDANYFERLYPYLHQVTASSVEDASNLEAVFPGLKFVRTSGVKLPFADQEFDIAFSAAVLEHVGDDDQQRRFVVELLRVARSAYLLTPNRWFPIDFHTMLPLIHWLPRRYHQAILRKVGHEFLSRTENLNLVSRRQLRSLFPPGVDVSLSQHRILGFPSNLVAYARRVDSKPESTDEEQGDALRRGHSGSARPDCG
jgi:SAM-dependent methyltransferase